MEKISNDVLLKTLSFISDNDNKVSRYEFDKFLTKTFLFEESFNVILNFLFNEKLADILKKNGFTFIILSSSGFQKLESLQTIHQ